MMDLYRHLGAPVRAIATLDGDGPPPGTPDRSSGVPQTVITKVVETTDEGRVGLLLGPVAP